MLSRMIAVMAVATSAIGLLPTWSAVGPVAPAALLVLRVAQGFSAGGEVSSSVVFLIESAPEGRRGWYGGWHLGSIAIGLALRVCGRCGAHGHALPRGFVRLGVAGRFPGCAARRPWLRPSSVGSPTASGAGRR
jgi:MFS family permease